MIAADKTPVSFDYIDKQSGLDSLVSRIEQADEVALDTEADSLHHYFEKVCLIQMSIGDDHFIVDPLAGLNMDAFFRALSKCNLIFHGAEYDLRILRASHKFRPRGEVFDTMLAAQLVEGEARSLAALVEKYIGVELSKQGRRSDWSRRPLSEQQLAYAVNDTRFLDAIAERLRAELARLSRLEWHRQACRRMVKETGREKPEPDLDRIWRIKGLSGLDRRQLAFVREIWHWRDRQARQADKPPFKVLGNKQLIELALWAAARKSKSFKSAPKLPRNLTGARLTALKQAIEKAERLKDSRWPEYLRSSGYIPPEPGPELEELRAKCDAMAKHLGLASSLVATRRQLEAISLSRPTSRRALQAIEGLMDWQVDLLAPIVKELFADES